MTFGRIVWYITPADRRTFSTLWVPVRWITPLFVTFDMFAFLIQLGGITDIGSAYTSTDSPPKQAAALDHGLHVLKFGLLIQLLCFAIFAVVGLRFMLVSRKWGDPAAGADRAWRSCAWMVNGATTLITVGAQCPSLHSTPDTDDRKQLRAVYRVFEFSESIGTSSASSISSNRSAPARPYLVTHEWPFWVCDALPILGRPGILSSRR